MSKASTNGAARFVRGALHCARFDLAESLRSRRVLIFLVLYLALSVGSAILFTELLQAVEEELALQLLVARTDLPGSMTQAVVERPEVRRVLYRFIRDNALVDAVLSVPPIALLFGWVTLTFTPLLVVLTSSDAISEEVAAGTARFALFRVSRGSYVFGKLIAQTALMCVGLLLAALGAYIVGAVQLGSFEPVRSALYIGRYALTSSVYAFSFLGLTLGISQLTRSVPWSRALGLFAMVTVIGLERFLVKGKLPQRFPVTSETLCQVLPPAHKLDLWRVTLSEMAPALVMLVALGLTFFAIGASRFVRRDL